MQAAVDDRWRVAAPSLAVRDRGPITAGMPRTAKVIRIGAMVKELLEEIRRAPLDHPGRARLWHAFDVSVGELSGCLPPRLSAELGRLMPLRRPEPPGDAELRLAQAQLTGWLEGLFQAIAASLDAQEAAMLRRLVEQPPPEEPPGA
jgi:Protein of unknown function (DUF2587)